MLLPSNLNFDICLATLVYETPTYPCKLALCNTMYIMQTCIVEHHIMQHCITAHQIMQNYVIGRDIMQHCILKCHIMQARIVKHKIALIYCMLTKHFHPYLAHSKSNWRMDQSIELLHFFANLYREL